jgi:hypothetical protein
VDPDAKVTAVDVRNTLATLACSVPALMATEPANEGLATPMARVPEPSFVRELAEVAVIAPVIVVLPVPPTLSEYPLRLVAPERVRVPESDWMREAPDAVTAPVRVLFPETF